MLLSGQFCMLVDSIEINVTRNQRFRLSGNIQLLEDEKDTNCGSTNANRVVRIRENYFERHTPHGFIFNL